MNLSAYIFSKANWEYYMRILYYKPVFIIFAIMLLFCSCKSTVESYSDELVSSKWGTTLQSGYEIRFSIDNNIGVLSIDKNEYKSAISGVVLLSQDTIVITDSITNESYSFIYKITGDTLYLTYDSFVLKLNKISD